MAKKKTRVSKKAKTRAASSRRGQRPEASSASTGAQSAGRSNWRRVQRMSDAQIRAAIASDPDAAPELDAAWFAKAKLVMPENKQLTSLRLDPDVLIWFRSFGKGYQTRINAVLRAYMKAHIR